MSKSSLLLGFIFTVFFLLQTVTYGQSVVVSSYFNAADPRDEWTELLVIQDNTDLSNYTLRDNNSSQTGWQTAITFNNISLWNHVRAGTIIVIWHRQFSFSGPIHPLDVSGSDGYIEVHANDAVYFTGGTFGNPPSFGGSTLNIAGGGDILELRDPGANHIHALAHITTPGANWTALLSPKLNHKQSASSGEAIFVCPGTDINEYGWNSPQDGLVYTSKSITLLTQGLPNQCVISSTANSDFWRSQRQPVWPSPSLTAAFTPPSTINLSWNACTDVYPADNTQGYLILRNTVNTFTAPTDGHTYSVGDVIAGATVIAMISSSQTITYTDNYAIPCGTSAYYQVYAYRYATDGPNGNDYNIARGRAYNESTYAGASVTIAAAPDITTLNAIDATCGLDNGSITITATGGTAPLQYSIDNGATWQTSNVFPNLAPGSYTVVINDANGCQSPYSSNPVIITNIPGPDITQVDHADASCGIDNGSITVTAGGGSPPLQYSIDNGVTWQFSPVFINLAPGSYTVIVKDINDCDVPYATNPVVLSMIPAPVAPTSATSDRNNFCSDDPGNIVLTATGGSGLTLEWFTGSCGGTFTGTGNDLSIPSPVVTTTYFVYYTSATCGNSPCTSVTVTVFDPPTASDAGPDQSLCGVFTASLAGNQPIVGTGLWTVISGPGSAIFSDPALYNSVVTVSQYGIYSFSWTISTGAACAPSTDDVECTFSDAISVTAGSNSPVCESNTINLSSSISGATYDWTGPNGFTSDLQNPDIPGATLANAGTYNITVSNIPGGCPATTGSTVVEILENPASPASASAVPDEICTGYTGLIQLTANGGSGTELVWFSESCNGTVIGTGNIIDIPAPLVTTTYFASWSSDQCGNSSCVSATVAVTDPPSTADAGDDQSLCGLLTATLAANNPAIGTGEWTVVSGPGTVTFSDPALYNSQATVSIEGVYVLLWTISSSTACAPSSNEVSLNFGDAIQVLASSNSPVCTGTDINLTSSISGATYSWTGPNGFISNLQNPVILNATLADAGSYTVQVTGISGGCPPTSNSTDVAINLSPAEPASVSADITNLCAGSVGNISLTASGGAGDLVEWLTGGCSGSVIGTGMTIVIPAPSVTTTYDARWTSLSCGNSLCKSVTVVVEDPPSQSFAGVDQSICNQLYTTLAANTPLAGSGQWTTISGPGTILYTDPAAPNCFINASNMGTYLLRWTITSGIICPASTDDMSVEFGNQIIVSANSNSPVCEGEDITLFSSISGATYGWTGPGGYTSSQQNPVISNASVSNSGDYTITVSDIPGGCPTTSATITVVVSNIPSAPLINSQNISGSAQDVCEGSNVTYSIASPVVGSDYNWTLSGGGTVSPAGSSDIIEIEWLAANGTFYLTVNETNTAGCEGVPFALTVNIIPTTHPAITIGAGNNPACAGEAVQFTATVTDVGISPVYYWTRNGTHVGSDNAIYILDTPSDNDLITCEITSNNLCADPLTASSNTIELNIYDSLKVSFSVEEPLCSGIPVLLSPGSNFASYLWNDGSTGQSITVEDPGIYWVIVTDTAGCIGTDTIVVESCAGMLISIPNAFTPNSDGLNDRFTVVCSNPAILSGYEINIYNRWGQLIHTGNDAGEGWDGMQDGKPCPMDLYAYILSYTATEPKIVSKQIAGTFILVR